MRSLILAIFTLFILFDVAIPVQKDSTTHNYILHIVDSNNNPLSDVLIRYWLSTENIFIQKDDECFSTHLTSDNGIFHDSIKVISKYYGEGIHHPIYISRFQADVIKEGYYPQSISLLSVANSDFIGAVDVYKSIKSLDPIHKEPVIEEISLYCNKDYISTESLSRFDTTTLNNIYSTVNTLLLDADFSNISVKPHFIDITEFQHNSYFHLYLLYNYIFDTSKFSLYDIGSRLFDVSLREIICLLNENNSNVLSISGFHIEYLVYLKNYYDKYSYPNSHKYHYYIPLQAASDYCNQMISGQKLINLSSIIYDDRLIEIDLH